MHRQVLALALAFLVLNTSCPAHEPHTYFSRADLQIFPEPRGVMLQTLA